MKKYIFIIIVLFQIACKKELGTSPTDTLTPEFYFNNEADLNKSLTGVYYTLSESDLYGLFFPFYHAYNADELYWTANATPAQAYINTYTPTEPLYQSFWRKTYQGILRANLLLENVNKPSMDETKRNIIKGEALFLRGYFYYLLATHYGGVPMPLTSTFDIDNPGIPRSTLKQVYTQILADMTAAEPIVSKISAYTYNSRITQTAIQGMLARVNLSMAGFPLNETTRYTEALTWATKVYTSGLHALNPDYTKVFINLMQDVYDTKESLWEIEFTVKTAPSSYIGNGRWGNTIGLAANDLNIGFVQPPGFASCTGKLFKSYASDTNDVRMNWNCANFTYTAVATGATKVPLLYTQNQYNRQMGKFRREYELTSPKQKNITPCNFPVLRYSDVLLMLAEAENEVNGTTALALTCLNLVRTRAKATNYAYTGTGNFVISNKDDFRTVIQNERLRELCYETQRRLDLIRWGIYIPTMKALSLDFVTNAPNVASGTGRFSGDNTSERNYYYPIPQYEINLNPLLTQNPGY